MRRTIPVAAPFHVGAPFAASFARARAALYFGLSQTPLRSWSSAIFSGS